MHHIRYICTTMKNDSDFFTNLKELIRSELGYLPDGRGLNELLATGERVAFSSGGVIIGAGQRQPALHIIYSGIARFIDFDGDRERTFGFALPGTMFFSEHSFVMNLPSYYQCEACCDTEVLRIAASDYWAMVERHHELAIYMLHYAHGELFFREYKNATVIKGNAAQRYRAIWHDRPVIIEKVQQKIIASYLGVTPEYLSSLKRSILKEGIS